MSPNLPSFEAGELKRYSYSHVLTGNGSKHASAILYSVFSLIIIIIIIITIDAMVTTTIRQPFDGRSSKVIKVTVT